MANAPVYDFKYNYNDYLNSAKNQVNPMYDAQVEGQQQAIPLIQQQYKTLADQILQGKADTEGAINKQATNSIGANRLRNATMGIFDSSENRANERNTMDDVNTNLSSLTNSTNNQISLNNAEQSQKVLNIQNLIKAINSERNDKVSGLAGSLLSAAQNAYDKKYGADSTNYWNQLEADTDARQFDIQQQNAALDRQLELQKFQYQKSQDQDSKGQFDPGATSSVQSQVFYDGQGNAKSSGDIYRDLMQNASYYRSIGADVDSLWSAWRNMTYGSKYGYGKSQSEYDSLIKAANATNPSNLSRLANNPKY